MIRVRTAVCLLLVLTVSLLLVTVCVIAQKSDRNKGKTGGLLSGDIVIATSSELIEVENQYFAYEPKPDITAYELALLLPLFSGPSYGNGEFHTGGAIVPARDRHVGGWPSGAVNIVLCLTEFDLERLETATRHLRKLPSPKK